MYGSFPNRINGRRLRRLNVYGAAERTVLERSSFVRAIDSRPSFLRSVRGRADDFESIRDPFVVAAVRITVTRFEYSDCCPFRLAVSSSARSFSLDTGYVARSLPAPIRNREKRQIPSAGAIRYSRRNTSNSPGNCEYTRYLRNGSDTKSDRLKELNYFSCARTPHISYISRTIYDLVDGFSWEKNYFLLLVTVKVFSKSAFELC